jgi:AraC-like DNA-binding protein
VHTDRLFLVRRLVAGELAASQDDLELRTPHLRIAVRTGRNVASDFALLGRAVPYMTRLRRPQLMVVIAGEGRVEEQGRRAWFSPREFLAIEGGVLYDGTVAWAGAESKVLLVEWDPAVYGASFDRRFDLAKMSETDRARLDHAATRAVSDPRDVAASAEVLDVFRALGVPFDRVDLPPAASVPPALQVVSASLDAHLSALDRSPAIEDLAAELGWNARRIHRSIKTLSERFGMAWSDWRSALQAHRMLAATRLLSAPGATTEGVARLAGFRSPTSLCHAFANAGLPSPGALARAARDDVLRDWTQVA